MDAVKNENFKRISAKRLSKLSENFRLLGNLANTAYYEYSEEDIEKLFAEIGGMFADLRQSFEEKTNHKKFALEEQ